MAHRHSVYDTDSHFSIDPITRTIRNESSKKTTLMQGDHNSERFTFEMPRMIEGHDMSVCDRVEVHFTNTSSANRLEKSADVYIVDDAQIFADDEQIVIFSWLISGNATKYSGTLSFKLKFICLDGTNITYSWNTAVSNEISIGNGMDNAESVIEHQSDAIGATLARVNEAATKINWFVSEVEPSLILINDGGMV